MFVLRIVHEEESLKNEQMFLFEGSSLGAPQSHENKNLYVYISKYIRQAYKQSTKCNCNLQAVLICLECLIVQYGTHLSLKR